MVCSAAEQVQILLSLGTSQARRAWLEQHVPRRDEALVCALREEALRCARDDPHEALQVAEAAADAAAVWGDQQTQATALHIEADALTVLDDHKAALDLYGKAAALFRSLGLELEAARVAVGHLAAMMYLGLYGEALALADWAGDVFRAAGDQLALGKMVMNRGNIFARLGRFAEARVSYAEARDIFAALGDARHLAMVNVNDANVLTELDDFRQAERMFWEARAYFEAEGLTSLVAQVDLNLAYLYFTQGDYQRALVTFNRAREAYAALDSTSDVAYVDMHRSDAYLALNLWQEALERVRDARPVFEAASMAWEAAHLWLNEAVALAHTDGAGAPTEALEQARRMFTQEQNEMGLAVTDLCQATFELRSGNIAAAREAALRARGVFERAGLRSRAAQCDVILGKVALLERDVAHAAECFSRGLAQLEQADVPAVAFACFYGLGRSEEIQRRQETALHCYRRAIADVERLQTAIGAEDYKIAFLQDKLQVYEAAILLSLQRSTPEAVDEAFETVERAKSRALLDALARGPITPADKSPEAGLWAEIERLKGELNWYYNRLYEPRPGDGRSAARVAALTAAITQRERELKELLDRWRSPDLAAAPRNPIGAVKPAQVRAVLPENAMLLEFYSAREQVFAFGISQEGTWVQRMPAAYSEIAEALGKFYFQIAKFGYGPAYREAHAAALLEATNRQLRRLYEALFLPIAERLTAETLIVVPHGVLHHVPFQALFDGERYLIEAKTISYAPSATILHRVLSGEASGNGRPPLLLGVSDPTIPYALSEVEAIAALFPGADVRLGEQATVASLMENETRPAFLHLSTHATFRSDNPLFSALRLADGWVTVNDIYGLSGSAPLVTLSACETGRSQVAAGDELVGLCRGFFSAGARALVVSLWTVDDDSTARLMRRFYGELRTGHPVNQALRTAQLAIKAEMGHPYYWAPFILTGDIHTCLSPAWMAHSQGGDHTSPTAP